MHCICSVLIHGFYTSCHERAVARPLVVHRDKVVIDASDPAMGHGVSIGQSLAEAKAIFGSDGAFVAWDREVYEAAQKRFLDVCANFSECIEPREQHTALVDLSGHPRPHQIAALLKEELLSVTGLNASIGLGGCRWIAELAARIGDETDQSLAFPRRFIAPLTTLALSPIASAERERLVALGYPTIGSVAQVPVSLLRQQFGRSSFVIARAAQGGGDPRVHSLYPPASLTAQLTFDGAPDSREGIDRGIAWLAARLGRKLVESEGLGHDLVLLLEHEGLERTRRERQFTKPIARSKDIVTALQLMIEPLPEKPIVRLVARLEAVTRQLPVQRELTGQRTISDRPGSLKAALSGLQGTFGENAVQKASELVEPRFLKVRRIWARTTGWSFG